MSHRATSAAVSCGSPIICGKPYAGPPTGPPRPFSAVLAAALSGTPCRYPSAARSSSLMSPLPAAPSRRVPLPTCDDLMRAVADGQPACDVWAARFAEWSVPVAVPQIVMNALDPLLIETVLGPEESRRWLPLLREHYLWAREVLVSRRVRQRRGLLEGTARVVDAVRRGAPTTTRKHPPAAAAAPGRPTLRRRAMPSWPGRVSRAPPAPPAPVAPAADGRPAAPLGGSARATAVTGAAHLPMEAPGEDDSPVAVPVSASDAPPDPAPRTPVVHPPPPRAGLAGPARSAPGSRADSGCCGRARRARHGVLSSRARKSRRPGAASCSRPPRYPTTPSRRCRNAGRTPTRVSSSGAGGRCRRPCSTAGRAIASASSASAERPGATCGI